MESTTLEQAAESLLSTAPETTGGEDNLSEAVNEITEPEDDGPGEEIEVTDEYEDDVEASDDYYDDAEIDDDLVDVEAQDTNLIPVKVDGKDENWTLDQLKQSAAGQAAINKRFQEVAEARKEFERETIQAQAQIEQHAKAVAQQRDQILQMHQQMQQGGIQQPTPPSRELFEQDPIGFMEEKLKYDEAKVAYDQNMQQIQLMQQQKQQVQEAASQSYLQEQAEILKQYIPDIADPIKGPKIKTALVDTGAAYGFSEEEMSGVTDSRYIRAMNDARKWRQLEANRGKAQQKGQKARPVVKAGAKKRQDGNAATRTKAQSRLQKTGSIDDAVNLIFNS
jgi:hypothetical protein